LRRLSKVPDKQQEFFQKILFALAAERSAFLGDELSAGGFGGGNDLVEALITAQRVPARIEAQIRKRRTPNVQHGIEGRHSG